MARNPLRRLPGTRTAGLRAIDQAKDREPGRSEPLDLETLLTRIRACRLCAETPARAPLPHAPRPVLRVAAGARILVCGQAPGTRVHQSGMPFTDPSGDRLREWMGVTEDVFYDQTRIAILPMGFCFPGLDSKGGDLPPRTECAPAWREPVLSQLRNVRLVLLIGAYAQRWHLARIEPKLKRLSLTDLMLNWRDVRDLSDSPRYLPLPHPSWRNTAWIKRHPWFDANVLPQLRSDIQAALLD